MALSGGRAGGGGHVLQVLALRSYTQVSPSKPPPSYPPNRSTWSRRGRPCMALSADGRRRGHVRPGVGAEVIDPGIVAPAAGSSPAKQEHLVPAREAITWYHRADGRAGAWFVQRRPHREASRAERAQRVP